MNKKTLARRLASPCLLTLLACITSPAFPQAEVHSKEIMVWGEYSKDGKVGGGGGSKADGGGAQGGGGPSKEGKSTKTGSGKKDSGKSGSKSASYVVSKATAKELADLFKEYEGTLDAAHITSFTNLARVILEWVQSPLGWLAEPADAPVGNNIVQAVQLISTLDAALQVKLVNQIQLMRFKAMNQNRPKADQEALKLIHGMFLRPQEFRPGSFEIKGNKIHFKNVPYTDKKHSVRVDRGLAGAFYDKMQQYIAAPTSQVEANYLIFGSPWLAKIKAAAANKKAGVSAIELTDREYLMMRAAIYHLPEAEKRAFTQWIGSSKPIFPSSETFLDAAYWIPGMAGDTYFVEYWY